MAAVEVVPLGPQGQVSVRVRVRRSSAFRFVGPTIELRRANVHSHHAASSIASLAALGRA